MTHDEAKKVASVLIHCDSGCDSCVGDLGERMKVKFPDFAWGTLLNEAHNAQFSWRKDDRWGWIDSVST